MIANSLTSKIAEALKAKDEIRLSTLRMLSSAFNYEKIAKQHDLSDEEELVVVKREAKKRQDAIVALTAAQGKATSSTTEELIQKLDKEKQELAILEEYLPVQMSDEELSAIVSESISQMGVVAPSDFGKVMGSIMAKVKGKADGTRVSAMVKAKLG